MVGKKESAFMRDNFWGNTSTSISDIRIESKDQNKTVIYLISPLSRMMIVCQKHVMNWMSLFVDMHTREIIEQVVTWREQKVTMKY
jgi:hypothetical protein